MGTGLRIIGQKPRNAQADTRTRREARDPGEARARKEVPDPGGVRVRREVPDPGEARARREVRDPGEARVRREVPGLREAQGIRTARVMQDIIQNIRISRWDCCARRMDRMWKASP